MPLAPRNPWRVVLSHARQHITAQGEVVYAANLLHDEFFNLFVAALSFERSEAVGRIPMAAVRLHSHVLAIWHVIQSDKAQRDMALEAISTAPSLLDLEPAVKRLTWAKNRAAKLAEYRNVVAHSGVLFYGTQKGKKIVMVPRFASHGARPSHEGRLKQIDGFAFWRSLRNDLLKLRNYVEGVTLRMMGLECARQGAEFLNAPKSWPDRPRLQSLDRIQAIEKALTPVAPRAKRRTRRKSSGR